MARHRDDQGTGRDAGGDERRGRPDRRSEPGHPGAQDEARLREERERRRLERERRRAVGRGEPLPEPAPRRYETGDQPGSPSRRPSDDHAASSAQPPGGRGPRAGRGGERAGVTPDAEPPRRRGRRRKQMPDEELPPRSYWSGPPPDAWAGPDADRSAGPEADPYAGPPADPYAGAGAGSAAWGGADAGPWAGADTGAWAGADADDPGGGRKSRRRGARIVMLVVFLLLLLMVGLAVGYVRQYFEWGEVGEAVTVTIPEGATLSDIGSILEDAGVVRHSYVFVRKVKDDGHESDLKPGTYDVRVNEPYESLIAVLLTGEKPKTATVAVPEGLTVEQTARQWAEKMGFKAGAYRRIAADDPPRVKLDGYTAGTTLEGLLFPATYEVLRDLKPRAAIDLQLETLFANLEKVDLTRAHKAKLTTYDVLIIASLVEREARVAEERPLVAAVIWNRLRIDMPLQIDATIQYALPEHKDMLTYDDLEVDSPYNTYKRLGLPPTPIASPGLSSIQAAADPADVNYLYYVAKNDGTGAHYFSQSYQEFLQNKAKAAAEQ
jgi:UPF0755 protein